MVATGVASGGPCTHVQLQVYADGSSGSQQVGDQMQHNTHCSVFFLERPVRTFSAWKLPFSLLRINSFTIPDRGNAFLRCQYGVGLATFDSVSVLPQRIAKSVLGLIIALLHYFGRFRPKETQELPHDSNEMSAFGRWACCRIFVFVGL